ncbi:U32 family peptidase C-terminal domain-containing protein, partial [Klebsiella pneumoniae]|uniref:U32 family peptidase C-terminal domain-containing protein n=1 Tax=Klebsiella pneumoniae TaxID=573 RepID=UPI003F7B01EE
MPGQLDNAMRQWLAADNFTADGQQRRSAVAVKNKFSVGDSLELMTPQGNVNFT